MALSSAAVSYFCQGLFTDLVLWTKFGTNLRIWFQWTHDMPCLLRGQLYSAQSVPSSRDLIFKCMLEDSRYFKNCNFPSRHRKGSLELACPERHRGREGLNTEGLWWDAKERPALRTTALPPSHATLLVSVLLDLFMCLKDEFFGE